MSTYVKEKVLRIPMKYVNMDYIKNIIAQEHEDYEDDFSWYLETTFPDIFEYGTAGKFQTAPTEEAYIDYVLEYDWDANGEYGKVRTLTDNEKAKYLPIFQKIDVNINMDYVHLVEFCWYNSTEAPNYYDDVNDPFYNEI